MTKDLRQLKIQVPDPVPPESIHTMSQADLNRDGLWNRQTVRTARKKNHDRDVFKSNMKKCKYCHATENLTVDHKIPLVLGGKDKKSNWQCLCMRCNVMKSNIPHGRLKQIFKWHMQITMEKAARKVKSLYDKTIPS